MTGRRCGASCFSPPKVPPAAQRCSLSTDCGRTRRVLCGCLFPCQDQSGYRSRSESCTGSTTESAPQAVARARRPGEESLAITCVPARLQHADHREAGGPHPITIATSPCHLAAPDVSIRRPRTGQRGYLEAPARSGSETSALLDDEPLGVGARRHCPARSVPLCCHAAAAAHGDDRRCHA